MNRKDSIYFNYFHKASDEALTLIFIHGAGMDGSVWREQAEGLKNYAQNSEMNLVTIDLPAHGQSGGEVVGHRIDQKAEAVYESLQIELNGPVVICGHSMGALIALQLAKIDQGADKQIIQALCLCGVAAKMPVHPDLLDLAQNNLSVAAKMIAKGSFGSKLAEDEKAAKISTCQKLVEASASNVLYHDLKACNDFAEIERIAEGLSVPVQLLLGSEDKLTPVKKADSLQNLIEKCSTTMFETSGHMMMQEDTVLFNKSLQEFILRLRA